MRSYMKKPPPCRGAYSVRERGFQSLQADARFLRFRGEIY